MTMHVQTFLREGGDVLDLTERYAIDVKYHPRYPSLVMLKYDQIASPFREPIVQECRGVILDAARGWNVVSRPFDKFFNYGEALAAPIDWENAQVEEKVDGSLCTLYYYDGMWQVASSGLPDAGGKVNGADFTFNKLFWDTFNDMDRSHEGRSSRGLMLPPVGCEHLCFMFELTSKYNRIVVQHIDSHLTLLAVRNVQTGEYDPYSRWADYYPSVWRSHLRSQEEVQAALARQSGLVIEGFVIVNPDGSRVKMKNDDYVRLHHLRDSIAGSPKALCEIVRANESTEFLIHFPEWQGEYDVIRDKYDELVTHLEQSYEAIKDIPVQKDFALEAVKSRCSGALFQLRSGRIKSVRHHLAEIPIKNFMVLLGLKEE